MKYIWQNYSAENNFRVEINPLSPYLEVGNVGEKIFGVNPIPRFYDIFYPLFENYSPERFSELENCLFHYLAKLDLKNGLHRVSIFEHLLDKEIREKIFGGDVARRICNFDSRGGRREYQANSRPESRGKERRTEIADPARTSRRNDEQVQTRRGR